MAAEAVAGWQPPENGQPVHWLDVYGHRACDGSGEPAPTVGLNPWRPSGAPCLACASVVADVRDLTERHGYELTFRFRYPAGAGSRRPRDESVGLRPQQALRGSQGHQEPSGAH